MDVKKVLITVIRVGIAILVVLGVYYAARTLGGTGYDFGYRIFTEPAVDEEPGTDILVQVKDDMTNKELGQMLEDKGLVRDGKLFYIQLYLSAYRKKINPGIYTLNTSMTAKDMMVVMAAEPETETETEEASEVIEDTSAAEEVTDESESAEDSDGDEADGTDASAEETPAEE